MIAISSSGTSCAEHRSEKTVLGLGHGIVVESRTVMYEIRKLPKMKVSLSRKIHIIGLPHGHALEGALIRGQVRDDALQPPGLGLRSRGGG